MSKAPRVSIIILNWNGWKDTIECLESLYRVTYPNYDVIVVDNASRDDSIQKIREYAEGKIKVNSKFFKYNPNNKPIKVFEISEDEAKQGKFNRSLYGKFDIDRRMILIKNKSNYGFAGGNNVGIKFTLSVLNADYVLLLNNDTVVNKKFLDELIKVTKINGAGIVGSKIYLYDSPTKIWSVGGEINWSKGYTYHITKISTSDNNLRYINPLWTTGCSILIESEVIHNVGLLDTTYFVNYEDTDFCLRAYKKGYFVSVSLTSHVWHKEGSAKIWLSDKKIYHSLKSQFIFFKRWNKKVIPYLLLKNILILHAYLLTGNYRLYIAGLKGIQEGVLQLKVK